MLQQTITLSPLEFITCLLIEAALLWYGIVRYKAFNQTYHVTNDGTIQQGLILNTYDDHFVEIATKIGNLNTPQDFANAAKCIQLFQDTYLNNAAHKRYVVEGDIMQLINLLEARTASLAKRGKAIHV